MANFTWNISIIDGEGHKSSIGGFLTAVDQPTAVTRLGLLAGEVPALINGRITNVQLTEELPLPLGNLAIPDESSEVELKGVFTFLCANNKRTRLSVPTLNRANILPNSDVIDGAVAGTFASTAIGNNFADSNYSDMTALVSAMEGYGRKR